MQYEINYVTNLFENRYFTQIIPVTITLRCASLSNVMISLKFEASFSSSKALYRFKLILYNPVPDSIHSHPIHPKLVINNYHKYLIGFLYF